jgi:hypothetical protein
MTEPKNETKRPAKNAKGPKTQEPLELTTSDTEGLKAGSQGPGHVALEDNGVHK